jgi:hypothetical protein
VLATTVYRRKLKQYVELTTVNHCHLINLGYLLHASYTSIHTAETYLQTSALCHILSRLQTANYQCDQQRKIKYSNKISPYPNIRDI